MSDATDAFFQNFPDPDGPIYPGLRSWPNRLLMEIECITDPDELEAACNLGLKRVALLRSGK